MPSNIEVLVTKIVEQGSVPLGVIYTKLNAGRKDENGQTVRQVVARMLQQGKLSLETVHTAKRGRPQQRITLNNNTNPTPSVEREDKPQGE